MKGEKEREREAAQKTPNVRQGLFCCGSIRFLLSGLERCRKRGTKYGGHFKDEVFFLKERKLSCWVTWPVDQSKCDKNKHTKVQLHKRPVTSMNTWTEASAKHLFFQGSAVVNLTAWRSLLLLFCSVTAGKIDTFAIQVHKTYTS